MKSEIWPDNVSIPEMTDWLAELRDDSPAELRDDSPAELRDDGPAELRDDGPAELTGDSHPPRSPDSNPYPEAPAPALAEGPISPGQIDEPDDGIPPRWAQVLARASTPSETSPPGWAWTRAAASTPPEGSAPAEASAPGEASAPAEVTARAVIGDQLRMPIMWCEMDSCISWHADPAALGEADARARAIGAGWRVDALGRLVCPHCQQTASSFRVSRPVVLWDRRTAITRAAWMADAHGNSAPRGHGRDTRRLADGHPPVSPPQPGRHRGRPAAEPIRVGPRA